MSLAASRPIVNELATRLSSGWVLPALRTTILSMAFRLSELRLRLLDALLGFGEARVRGLGERQENLPLSDGLFVPQILEGLPGVSEMLIRLLRDLLVEKTEPGLGPGVVRIDLEDFLEGGTGLFQPAGVEIRESLLEVLVRAGRAGGCRGTGLRRGAGRGLGGGRRSRGSRLLVRGRLLFRRRIARGPRRNEQHSQEDSERQRDTDEEPTDAKEPLHRIRL